MSVVGWGVMSVVAFVAMIVAVVWCNNRREKKLRSEIERELRDKFRAEWERRWVGP